MEVFSRGRSGKSMDAVDIGFLLNRIPRKKEQAGRRFLNIEIVPSPSAPRKHLCRSTSSVGNVPL